jgi:hypothetical protein
MTSSLPRGVISRLSSRGGTETSNVTLGDQTCKDVAYDSCTDCTSDAYMCMDQYTLAALSRLLRMSGSRGGRVARLAIASQRCAADVRRRYGTERCHLSSANDRRRANATRRSSTARVRRQHYQFIWIDGDRPSARYRTFSKALAADDHGLPRRLYPLAPDEPSGNQAKISEEQAPSLMPARQLYFSATTPICLAGVSTRAPCRRCGP